MCKKATRLLSMVLVIIMLINMLPMDILATDALDSGDGISIPTNEPFSNEDVHIIAEVTDKRTEYSKEYLLSNGLHMATVYTHAVHYEKNGQWTDINNTLRSVGTGTQVAYANTEGIWDVSFPQQLSTDKGVSITKDGYTLTFYMSGELRAPTSGDLSVAAMETGAASFALTEAEAATAQIQDIDLSAAKAEAEHPETIREGLRSRLQYADVYADTNIVYDLTSNQLKESIVMERYSSTLRGYQYTLNTGGLTPVLSDSGEIQLLGKESKEPVMVMPAPYLLDSGDAYSGDVTVELVKKGEQYILLYLLPQEWLADEARQWPVILDPVVSATASVTNIKDQCVFSEGWSDPESAVLDCGYGGSGTGAMRIYLQYVELPELTSADVIVDAVVQLYKVYDYGHTDPISVHKVLDTWDSMTMQWNNKADHDPIVQDFAVCKDVGYYQWNVTDIVRGWYEGENTGMMFKNTDNVETNSTYYHYQRFRSSDYSIYDTATKPTLSIVFRNNNGLESYWDYTSASAGRAGTGYVNNYTGNLVWIRGDMGFGGCVMPVSVTHIYNANDSKSNDFGMGLGWRSNYNQLVKEWEVDSNYYVWEDSDGTSHYFLYDDEAEAYVDEDGLELKLTVGSDGTYTLQDKNENTSYFDSEGRLTKQENNQATKSSITVTYTASDRKQISTVTDSAGRVYTFTYNDSGLLRQIAYKGSGTKELSKVTYSYNDAGQLISITDKDGKTCTYTYADNSADPKKNLIATAKDIDGYALSYTYTSHGEGQPARVSRVDESDGNAAGGYLTIEYSKNQTTFTDHNGNVQIMQFNNLGNTISVQDDQGRAQYAQYAINDASDPTEASAASETEEAKSTGKANQLIKSSKLQNTVGNILTDGSFEGSNLWSASSGAVSTSLATGAAYMGNKSLKLNRTVNGNAAGAYSPSFTAKAGQTYTFSAWVKTGEGKAYLALNDGNASVTSEVLEKNQDWTRLQVSYTAEAQTTLTAQVLTEEAGTFYLDCAQVEKAPTASRYNLIENGDFRGSTNAWSSNDGRTTLSDTAAPELSTDVYTMTGVYNSTSRISQTVNVSGIAGDCFILAGWAKGDSVPLGNLYGNDREFGLIATFNNADGTTSSSTIRFNPYADSSVNWQYAAAPIVATSDYTSITVELAYDYNMNTVYFDGIQLFKEQFGSSYTYDENGNVKSVTDIQGAKTSYEYENNDLTKAVLPTGAELTYTYDNYHNVLTATTETGVRYEFGYDELGRNTSVSIVNGNTKITSTMAETVNTAKTERTVTTTDAAGNVTTQVYDYNTNVLKWVQYPEDTEATRTEYDYDDETYRVASAAVTTDTGLDLSVGYTYTDDLLTKIATPTTTYNFTYGSFGLRSNIKVGTQTLASYDYTNDGNFYLEKLAYGNNDSVQYTYDDQGRVTKQTWENGDTVTYQYDNSGALATVTDSATGRKTTYYYDFTDRLMKYVESGEGYSHSVGYEYDTINNLTALVEVINGIEHKTSYAYDDDNRVSYITNGDATKEFTYDGFSRVSSQVTSHNGTPLLTENFTYRGFTDTNTTTGQVEGLTISASGLNRTYTYTYDKNGNIKSVSDGTNETSYVYDTAGQLLRENNQAAGKTWVWTYDNAGNIKTRTEYAYSDGTLGDVLDTVTYGYDNANWKDLLTSYGDKSITYDEIGNPLNDGNWAYTWEHGRQLASMTNGTTTIDYEYNADGIRTKKTVTTARDHVHFYTHSVVEPTCTENGYTKHFCECGYIYVDSPVPATGHTYTASVVESTCTTNGYTLYTCACGDSYQDGAPGHTFTTLVVEPTETVNGFTLHECECGYRYESDPVASLGSTDAEVIYDVKEYDYIYNGSSLTQLIITTTNYGDSPVVETLYFAYDGSSTMSVTYNGTNYYYATNLQGDVIAILDDEGNTVVEYAYDAWGNILNIGGSDKDTLGVANPLTYRGYVYDTESGLYYLQSRYYAPEIGRWINADNPEILTTVFENFAQYNLFAYCFNSPVNMADEMGTWPSWVKKAIAVALVTTAVVAATVITVATCGAGSVAGVAMITATATLAAKATEVAVLQAKKGKSEGKSNGQIAKDTVESVYNNGAKIIGLTPVTKTAGVAFHHGLNTMIEKGFGGTQSLSKTLKSTGGKTLPYVLAGFAWVNTIISATTSKDPMTRAEERGYILI